MSPEWRNFEELVARIEQALAPSGAIVKSPDRIPDKVTGEPREVDVAIRYKVGTVPILVTLECRDRSSIQDVRWIEELAEKKRSIGASLTVAVSSTGFSEPAIKKAASVGIETRTLKDVAPEQSIEWLKVRDVVLDVFEWQLSDLAVELYDVPDGAELVGPVQESFRSSGPAAPIFVRNSDGKKFSVENILIEWRKRNGDFFPNDLPADGKKAQKTLHQQIGRNALRMETTKGSFDINVIHITLDLWRSQKTIPISTLANYSGSSSLLVQIAEWKLRDHVWLSLHRDMQSGETKVTMTVK